MSITTREINGKLHESDSMKFSGKNKINGNLTVYLIKTDNYILLKVPTLNLTSYGNTKEGALEELDIELDNFFEDLNAMSSLNRSSLLRSLGWEQNDFFKKRLSNTHIDKDGALVGLEIPEDAEISVLSTEFA